MDVLMVWVDLYRFILLKSICMVMMDLWVVMHVLVPVPVFPQIDQL